MQRILKTSDTKKYLNRSVAELLVDNSYVVGPNPTGGNFVARNPLLSFRKAKL